MKRNTSCRLLLPDGAQIAIAFPEARSHLQRRCPETGFLLEKQLIIGYATTPDGLMVYVPGEVSIHLRAATEYASVFVQEQWFGSAPATLEEIRVEDYAVGDLLYYPCADQVTLRFLRTA
ncbi:hypothetical protein [Hymenobacter sp. AT01-02]|uniref:hypothetical protein n=1 Tax=Hymenobacter sp. AT01-02 TaxID=1571877 RepID=UPI0005F16B76|nr:hypothetical protein [Hymenobacter sp. AT01-02]